MAKKKCRACIRIRWYALFFCVVAVFVVKGVSQFLGVSLF